MARRSYSLQTHEQQLYDQFVGQRRNLLARYGEITLEMEELRKLLEGNAERQRQLLGEVVTRHGAQAFYNSARIEGQHLICDVPDDLPDSPPSSGTATGVQPINGRAHDGMAQPD